MKLLLLTTTALMMVLTGQAASADAVGEIDRLQRNGYGTPPDSTRGPKYLNDTVSFLELLETLPDSAMEVGLIDGSTLTLGGQSQVRVDEFVFDPNAGGKALLTISTGVLRFVTGEMPPGGVNFDTPTATIAIRGTNLRFYVHPNGDSLVIMDHGLARVTAKGTNQSVDIVDGQSVLVTSVGLNGIETGAKYVGDKIVDFGWSRRERRFGERQHGAGSSAGSSSDSDSSESGY